jgi:hypothetical protein
MKILCLHNVRFTDGKFVTRLTQSLAAARTHTCVA